MNDIKSLCNFFFDTIYPTTMQVGRFGRVSLKPPNGDMDPKFCKGVRCLPTRRICPRISRTVVNREGCCAVTECVKWEPKLPVKIPPTTTDAVESAVIDEKKDMIAAVYIKELEEEEKIGEEEEEMEEVEESRNYAPQWIAALVLIVVASSVVIAVTLPKIPKNKKDSK